MFASRVAYDSKKCVGEIQEKPVVAGNLFRAQRVCSCSRRSRRRRLDDVPPADEPVGGGGLTAKRGLPPHSAAGGSRAAAVHGRWSPPMAGGRPPLPPPTPRSEEGRPRGIRRLVEGGREPEKRQGGGERAEQRLHRRTARIASWLLLPLLLLLNVDLNIASHHHSHVVYCWYSAEICILLFYSHLSRKIDEGRWWWRKIVNLHATAARGSAAGALRQREC